MDLLSRWHICHPQILSGNNIGFRHQHQTNNSVFQLANVSRPGVMMQCLKTGFIQNQTSLEFLCVFLHKMANKLADILRALP